MLKKILLVLYKNSNIIRYKKIRLKDLSKTYLNQQGGTNPSKLKIQYNDYKYIFEKSKIDDDNYVLYATDELECVSIIINKSDKIAEIHGIGNYKTCVNTTLSNQSVGSLLLKITLKLLEKYKERFNITHIILADNSLKKCDNVDIELSTIMILLSGHTWYGNPKNYCECPKNKNFCNFCLYGKYGFRPYDGYTYRLNTIKNKKYENNIKIMKTITISEANILNYIVLTNKKSIIKDVVKLLEQHPDYLLTDFIKSFIHNYDRTCKYFYLFYQQLFDDIGLTNFSGQVFGLEI
jgi:hypothetical protein